MHYYQRWAANDESRKSARKQAEAAQTGQLVALSNVTATPTSQLKFVCDAWDQVGMSARANLNDRGSSGRAAAEIAHLN